jgi:hypothetical protein
MINYVVTGGCSFSTPYRWPALLKAVYPNKAFFNTALNSAGNDCISHSILFQTQTLLNRGISPIQILIIVMWSSFDRRSFWINPEQIFDFKNLLCDAQPHDPLTHHQSYLVDPTRDERGFLLGTPHCNTNNPFIKEWKRYYFETYYTDEYAVIENYTHMQRVQWFCEAKGVNILNLTFADLMHFPSMPWTEETRKNWEPTISKFKHAKFLQDMLDFKTWWFYKETGGMFDLVKDLDLGFEIDNLHPDQESHQYFTDNYLVPELTKRFML